MEEWKMHDQLMQNVRTRGLGYGHLSQTPHHPNTNRSRFYLSTLASFSTLNISVKIWGYSVLAVCYFRAGHRTATFSHYQQQN